MACLANTVQANPDSFYFALAGSEGPGSSLQSPATVIPAANGSSILNVVQTTGSPAPAAAILVSSQNGNDAIVQIDSTAGGNASLLLTTSGVGGKSIFLANDGGSTGSLAVGDNASGDVYMLVDTVNNNVSLGAVAGGAIPAGTVTTQSSLLVKDSVGGANAVAISPTTGTSSVISQTVASNGNLNLGSSVACPGTIAISDTGGAGTGIVKVGGNGGANILMAGQGGANPYTSMRTDATNSGVLTLGASVANATTVYVRDGTVANTAYVDITGGNTNSTALRLQGANTLTGANSAYVSTNLGTGAGGLLSLSSGYNDSPGAVQIDDATVKINRPITGWSFQQSGTVAALADGGSATIPNSGSPSIQPGLYAIMATNVSGTNQTGTQVSCVGYFSGNTSPGKWILGGNGFGQGLTNPTRNFTIQPTPGSGAYQTLTYVNTSGFSMDSGVNVYFIRLSGNLGI